MIISHKYKFIFIKTLKTAGTSVEVYLSDVCGEEDTVTPVEPEEDGHRPRNYKGRWNLFPELIADERHGRRRTLKEWCSKRQFYNHIPARVARHRISPKVWNRYFKFAIERNPWDKTLSHYYMEKDRSGGDLDFSDYLERGNFCHNQPIYCDLHGNLLVDKVIQYGSLNKELGLVFERLGVPYDGALGVAAKSGHRKNRGSYRDILSDRERELIGKIFDLEIKMHGYRF